MKSGDSGKSAGKTSSFLKIFLYLIIGFFVLMGVIIAIGITAFFIQSGSISSPSYAERANLQCSTYCDSLEPFLTGVANLTSPSIYTCNCIKDFGESNQKIVGSRPINTSTLAQDESLLKAVEQYSSVVKTSDVNIREKAGQIVKDCPSGDKECSVNAVYRYITEHLRYVNDPRGRQIIQTPEQTLAINGGDCEDLSILANSYMENLGIETATVLTPDHAYAAACNLNVSRLQEYASQSVNDYLTQQWTKSASSTDYWDIKLVTIDGELYYKYTPKTKVEELFKGAGYYWFDTSWADFNTSYFDSVRIDYTVHAEDGLHAYVLKSDVDLDELKTGGTNFRSYEGCSGEGVSFSTSCTNLTSFGALVLQNDADSGKSRVQLDVAYYLKPKPQYQSQINTITSYDLNNYGVRCVVIDPTEGPYRYPGSDRSVNKTRVMVTNLGHEVKDFGYAAYLNSFHN